MLLPPEAPVPSILQEINGTGLTLNIFGNVFGPEIIKFGENIIDQSVQLIIYTYDTIVYYCCDKSKSNEEEKGHLLGGCYISDEEYDAIVLTNFIDNNFYLNKKKICYVHYIIPEDPLMFELYNTMYNKRNEDVVTSYIILNKYNTFLFRGESLYRWNVGFCLTSEYDGRVRFSINKNKRGLKISSKFCGKDMIFQNYYLKTQGEEERNRLTEKLHKEYLSKFNLSIIGAIDTLNNLGEIKIRYSTSIISSSTFLKFLSIYYFFVTDINFLHEISVVDHILSTSPGLSDPFTLKVSPKHISNYEAGLNVDTFNDKNFEEGGPTMHEDIARGRYICDTPMIEGNSFYYGNEPDYKPKPDYKIKILGKKNPKMFSTYSDINYYNAAFPDPEKPIHSPRDLQIYINKKKIGFSTEEIITDLNERHAKEARGEKVYAKVYSEDDKYIPVNNNNN